jgi:hypothetical protein
VLLNEGWPEGTQPARRSAATSPAPARVGRRQGADAAAIEREVEQPLQRYCGPRSGGAVDDGRIVALAL